MGIRVKEKQMSWKIEQKIFGVALKSSGTRAVNYCETNGSVLAHPSRQFLVDTFNRLFPPNGFKEEVEKYVGTLRFPEGVFYFIEPEFFRKSKWYKQSHVEKKIYGVLARNPNSILYDPVKRTVEINHKIAEKPILKHK